MVNKEPNIPKRRGQKAASVFLTEFSGKPVAETTLATWRCRGGGPKFRRFGRAVVYEEPDLIEFAETRLSKPMASTSEAQPVKPSARGGVRRVSDFGADIGRNQVSKPRGRGGEG